MARDKDRDKDQEGDVLSTEDARDDEDQDSDPEVEEGKEIDTVLLLEQIAQQDQKILKLEEAIKSLKAKKKAGDTEVIAGALKALAGLSLSADGLNAFREMCPYLFKE